MCTKNHNHMMYASWNIECDTEFLSFWTIFCPFSTLKIQKNKIFKKWKKRQEILSFYKLYHKWWSYDDVWFLRYPAPDNYENQNFERMKKTTGDIILHMCIINEDHMMYGSWDMEHKRHKFLSVWSFFLLFYPTTDRENQNFEKIKKYWRYYHFTCLP